MISESTKENPQLKMGINKGFSLIPYFCLQELTKDLTDLTAKAQNIEGKITEQHSQTTKGGKNQDIELLTNLNTSSDSKLPNIITQTVQRLLNPSHAMSILMKAEKRIEELQLKCHQHEGQIQIQNERFNTNLKLKESLASMIKEEKNIDKSSILQEKD